MLIGSMLLSYSGDTVDGSEIPNNHLGWCWNPKTRGKNYQPQLVQDFRHQQYVYNCIYFTCLDRIIFERGDKGHIFVKVTSTFIEAPSLQFDRHFSGIFRDRFKRFGRSPKHQFPKAEPTRSLHWSSLAQTVCGCLVWVEKNVRFCRVQKKQMGAQKGSSEFFGLSII